MWQPKVEARALQALAVRPGESAYEVGTGSGYLAALLARRGAAVTSAEIHPDLQESAGRSLRSAGVANVTLVGGDSARAPLTDASYDVIVLTGSTPLLPPAFVERLNPGGRLFAVVGERPVMKALLVTKVGPGDTRTEELFETVLKPLANALAPARFRF